ncbi:MAG: capsular biosynthesis protein [Pseudomonadota bacterium]
MDKARAKYLALLMIGLPMLLAVIYYAVLSADRYVSESIITVRQASDSGGGNVPGIALMLAGVNPPSREDTLYLREYIHSLDMLKHLDQTLNLRTHFESEKLDPFFRLYGGTSQEWFLDYYRSRVEVVFDDTSSLLSVRAEGFSPEFAQALNKELLAQSERFVNEISHRMARDQMDFAEGELNKAKARYQEAKASLLDFQNKHNMLDPIAQAQAMAGLGTELEGEISKLEAELKNQLTYLQDDAHQVVALKNQIGALKAQLEKERKRVASGGDARLNTLAAEFQQLMLDAGFAEDAYKLALAAVENTRIEASRKLKSLVIVESPTLPEKAIYPRELYNMITLLLALLLLYGIARLAIATIEDHRE